MIKKELLIKRFIYNNEETTGGEANNIGEFFIDGEFFCYSLEDKIRRNQKSLEKTILILVSIMKTLWS